MFADIGNSASIAGVVVSLLGLGFAILQLRKLRGETRAAKEASESAERAIRRDLTITELAALREKIQELKDIHRRGDKQRAFVYYGDITSSLSDIGLRHPNLTGSLRERIRNASSAITDMESFADSLEGNLPLEKVSEFNVALSGLETGLIPELQVRMLGLD